ncbi:hypothetical protein [Streptomyces griseocarneus]|uniref:hypothetical protein n=1 Tax=Streptomyces griseocarneus TaxID=51201 RepID=UPI001CCDC078|nr:hypothetical protein [Streptomyces griseocarneus]MBZ6476315.1 hypothetical protein [Streptomyces griseocarneus]
MAEAVGLGIPVVALPFWPTALDGDPATERSVEVLRSTGIRVLYDEGESTPHLPNTEASSKQLIRRGFPTSQREVLIDRIKLRALSNRLRLEKVPEALLSLRPLEGLGELRPHVWGQLPTADVIVRAAQIEKRTGNGQLLAVGKNPALYSTVLTVPHKNVAYPAYPYHPISSLFYCSY